MPTWLAFLVIKITNYDKNLQKMQNRPGFNCIVKKIQKPNSKLLFFKRHPYF